MYKKLNADNSLFLIIDVQEKLVGMLEKNTIVAKTTILAKAADKLNIPTIITEQYPTGLGQTVQEIKSIFSSNVQYFEKTSFSAFNDEIIAEAVRNSGRKQIFLCGIEAHVCVLQTALDLIDDGYDVFIVQDACASRNKYEFKLAIDRLKHSGATITCSEMVIFELLKSSKHPNFRELQALIK